MSEVLFRVDLDTEGLVDYLEEEDFGKKVITYVKENKLNGQSFLSLTVVDLANTNIPPESKQRLLDKVTKLNAEHSDIKSLNPVDPKFVSLYYFLSI